MLKGKLIVIDGTDGSGKTIQTDLLVKRLGSMDLSVKMVDFPRYGKKSAGLVEDYLNGRFGTAEEVGPYKASYFYAGDRFAASFEMRQWLAEGKIIVSNRYVSANMGHQGGKIIDDEERDKFYKWLFHLEYEFFNIPQPDLNIVLHVDAAIAQKMVGSKPDREYLAGKKRDIHEADINHLRQAEKVFLQIVQKFPDKFVLVECVKDGCVMSRKDINDLIWAEVNKILKTKKQREE